MPYFVRVLDVRVRAPESLPTLESGVAVFPVVGDDDHTQTTIVESMRATASLAPTLDADVFYEGSVDWFDFGIVRARAGQVFEVGVTLSRSADRFVDADGEPAPEREIDLEGDADAYVDALQELAVHGDPEADDSTLVLPFGYRDLERTKSVLADIARDTNEDVEGLLVRIDDVPYRVTLSRKAGAVIEPLHFWTDDAALREWIRILLPPPGELARVKSKRRAKKHVPVDPARPLVTGSAQRRLEAISAMVSPPIVREESGMRITSWSRDPLPGTFEKVAAAVRAPENEGADFEEVRLELYRAIVRSAPSPEEAATLLEAALHVDSEQMRAQLYEMLAGLDVAIAHKALVFGLKHDSDVPRRRITQVIWRQAPALELLVKTELVPSWFKEGPESLWCKRIVSLLEREHIPVPAAWLDGSPEDLKRAIGH